MSSEAPTRVESVWLTLVVVTAATCVAQAFGRFTWGLVLPDARDDVLGGSNALAGLFTTCNVGAYMVGTFAVSWVSSRLTLVGLVRVGLVASVTGLALMSSSDHRLVMAVALVAMGLGGAAIWIPAPGIAARVLPAHRRGLAVATAGAGIGLGIVFAGQVAGYLRSRHPDPDVWQSVYRVELAVGAVVIIGAFTLLRPQGDRPALAGGFGGFSALRRIPGWVPLVASYASYGFSYILVIGFLVARLEDDSGFSADRAAAMFSIVGLCTVFGGLIMGPLSDRIGRRPALVGSFVAFAASGLLILTGGEVLVALGAVGIGSMFSAVPSLIIAYIVDETDESTYGPAFSAATLVFGLAQMISPQIGGLMADALGSFTWVFVVSAAVALLGALSATRLPAPLLRV